MPRSHRNGDTRYCGATTIVGGQSSVYVNGRLWAVNGDQESHGRGDLVVAGGTSVKINGIPVVTVQKDRAVPDLMGHPTGPTDPAGASSDVFAYE